jgi:FKBP-type peptidyl-prolyl cis-trans isomerase
MERKMPKIAALLLILAASSDSIQAQEESRTIPVTMLERASYGLGHNFGKALRKGGIAADVADVDLLFQGIRDGLSGAEGWLTDREIQQAIDELVKRLPEIKKQENLKISLAFLKENGKRRAVRTTASGLQYEIIREGRGASPRGSDLVTVHYKGTLVDGTTFDSSYSRGEPATFRVNQVIQGWQEALQLMRPGGKFKVYIPPSLAYGDRGATDAIGPNQALIFEIDLLSVGEYSRSSSNDGSSLDEEEIATGLAIVGGAWLLKKTW